MDDTAITRITPDQAKELIDSEHPLIVDVRTPEEYRGGHIPGAVNVPVDTINAQSVTDFTSGDKDQAILLYCKAGVRSAMAADRMKELGYRNLYDMQGGIVAWPFETIEGEHPGRER